MAAPFTDLHTPDWYATYGLALSDGTDTSFAVPPVAFHVGVAGHIDFTMKDGSVVSLLNVPVGIIYMSCILIDLSVGTPATDVVALW